MIQWYARAVLSRGSGSHANDITSNVIQLYGTTGVLVMNACTTYVDVLTNVTVTVLTSRPSEVQSFRYNPQHQVDIAQHTLENQ